MRDCAGPHAHITPVHTLPLAAAYRLYRIVVDLHMTIGEDGGAGAGAGATKGASLVLSSAPNRTLLSFSDKILVASTLADAAAPALCRERTYAEKQVKQLLVQRKHRAPEDLVAQLESLRRNCVAAIAALRQVPDDEVQK